MLNKIKNLITPATLALAMCASGASLAQMPNVNDPPPPKAPDVNDPSGKTAEQRQRERQEARQREKEAAEKHGKNEIDLPASFFKASELVGIRVDARGGEKIGDIKNVAINTENGRTRYAIVDNGSGTLYPIPFPAIKFAANRQRAVVDTTIDRMKDAATFKPDGWNTIGDQKWGEIVHEFYGINRDADTRNARPEFVPGNALIGSNAETRQGDNLGTIKDLMVDTEKSAVAYVVLANRRGAAGGSNNNNNDRDDDRQANTGSDRLFAVPWRALNVGDNGKKIVVRGLERDDLRDAPGFNHSRWPAYRELNWKDDDNFDSRPPRWVYGMSGDGNPNNNNNNNSNNNSNNGDRGELGGWQTHGKYGQMFRPNAIDRWSGTIVRTDTVTPLDGMDPGTAIIVKTDGQGNIPVHLGPEWFVKRQQGTFGDGVQVDVFGSRIDLNGKPVIMATQLRINGRTLTLRNNDGVPAWDGWQERK